MANFGLAFETVLVIALTYIHGLNIGLGTRQLASPHFAIPGFMYFCALFWVDQLRKVMIRNGIKKIGHKIRYDGFLAQNQIY